MMRTVGVAAQGMTGRERMLAALALRPVDRPPVWFMRQAGRHLPEYRRVRERLSFLDLCADEEANLLVSAEPWRRYGVDAAIVFNDILIPLRDMGMELDFHPAPRFGRLIQSAADAAGLGTPAYGERTDVCRCIAALRGAVGESAATLGFVGAPFTVASFAIAGVGDERPLASSAADRCEVFEAVQERLLNVLVSYGAAQARAGADAIQVFESLADQVPEEEYRRLGLPWLIELVRRLRRAIPGTPVIVFGRGLWPFLAELGGASPAALGVDHGHSLPRARKVLRDARLDIALQGNLDPDVLLGSPEGAARAASEILLRWRSIVPAPERGVTGWVFNLGRGVPAGADPRTVEAVVEAVRAHDLSVEARE